MERRGDFMYFGSLTDLIQQLFSFKETNKNQKWQEPRKPMSKKAIVAIVILFLIVLGITYYTSLPAFTTMSKKMWETLIVTCIAITMFSYFIDRAKLNAMGKRTKFFALISILVLVVFAGGAVLSSPIFSASKYANLMEVEDKEFAKDIEETNNIKNIALMDSQSAAVIGQRAIGSLSDVVSQYEVSNDYTQIDLKDKPMKVAPLEYAGLIKWFNNKKLGIPGYVMVDPLENEAKYVKLNQGMKYSMSGYLNDYLPRHLRFRYPTAVFQGYYFEIDEEGNPYYVCPVLKAHAGLFGAQDVKGVVICNPCNGNTTYYKVSEIPTWVDHAFDGELMLQKYRWKGLLSGGFINSIIGNKGCKQPTDDYGYRVMDGDVWMFTGVTSLNGDQSNIAFVMMNGRTGKAKYYPVVGCDESSAMSAAEGQVQHLNYTASFPALINISNQPTFIMALKDKSQLVKMYAMVNIEKYNIVATGTSPKEVLAQYREMMSDEGIVEEDIRKDTEILSKKISIVDVHYITMSGESYVYIKDQDGILYKKKVAEDENILFLSKGDKAEVTYEKGDKYIQNLVSWK